MKVGRSILPLHRTNTIVYVCSKIVFGFSARAGGWSWKWGGHTSWYSYVNKRSWVNQDKWKALHTIAIYLFFSPTHACVHIHIQGPACIDSAQGIGRKTWSGLQWIPGVDIWSFDADARESPCMRIVYLLVHLVICHIIINQQRLRPK